MKMKCIVILFVSLCMASSLLSSEATISIPQDATAVERYAAEELASYFNKIYAVTPEIRENAPNVPIQIGGDRESTEDLGLEGFEIQGDGSRLYIRGGTRRGPGILYGVYEYLERLGCRFLTKNVDYIPRRKTFELLKLELREKPSFEKLRYVYASGRFGVKMRTNFFSGNDRDKYEKLGLLRYALPDGKNGHSTFFLLPPEKYAEKHPEWYAIHKGKRSFEKMVGQLCLSNQEMTEEFIRNCKEYLRKYYKERLLFRITNQDNTHYCECPRCAAIDEEEGSHAGTLVRFINHVTEELVKDYPDLEVTTHAYQYTRFPPQKTALHKNILLTIACAECDFSKPFNGSGVPQNEEFFQLLQKWRDRCALRAFTDYGATFDTYQLPLPNFDAMAEHVRAAKASGCVGAQIISGHSSPGGEFNELRAYISARLFWNADADPWEIAKDFCDHYYGAGGKYLLDYIRYYHQYLPSVNATYFMSKHPEFLYDASFVEKAEQAFQKAYAAIGDDPILRQRIDLSYTSVQMMRIMMLRREDANSPKFQDYVEEFAAACKRFDITAKSEDKNSMETFIHEMRFTLREVPDFCQGKRWYARFPQIYRKLEWGKGIEDPLASSGKAIQMNTHHNAWAVYNKIVLPGFNTPVRYDAYVKIRVIPQQGAQPEDEAFDSGVVVSKDNLQQRTFLLKELEPEKYTYVKIGEKFPITNEGTAWVAPRKNEDKIQKILVDHFLFVETNSEDK